MVESLFQIDSKIHLSSSVIKEWGYNMDKLQSRLHDGGSGLRLNEDPPLHVKLSSVGWCLMLVFGPTVALIVDFFSSDCL